jgi:hypothetical protein
MKWRRIAGFTLIELLVVIAVDVSWTGGPPNGVFAYQGTTNLGAADGLSTTNVSSPASAKPPTLAAVTDGTSNTIAFGEWKTGTGNPNVLTIPQSIAFVGSYPPGITGNTPTMSMPARGAGSPTLEESTRCDNL